MKAAGSASIERQPSVERRKLDTESIEYDPNAT